MRLRTRLLAILGVSLFLSFAGVGVASALWSAPATVTTSVRAADLNDSCLNVTSIVNASFENPVVEFSYQNRTDVVGWSSRTNATGAPLAIEVWKGVTEGIEPPVGNQFVELNSTAAGTLYQTIATTPGQTLQWSLLHRGRQGPDTMQLSIGAPGTPGISQGQFTTDRTAWVRYSGAYVVPAGQTQTELNFMAVSTSSGNDTVGNLLDDVSFGTGPCLTATSSVAKVPSGGAYNVGDLVQYSTTVTNIGSSLASHSTYAFPIPAGLELVAGTLAVDGAVKTDAVGDDTADYSAANRTLTARLGTGATATVGGSVAQQTSTVISFQARIQTSAASSTIGYQPTIGYVNDLAPNWPRTALPANAPIQVAASADLAMTASASPTVANRGSATPVTWTFPVTNNGPSAAAGAALSLTYPSGLTGTSLPTVNGVACASAASCDLGAFAVGQTKVVAVSRTVPTTATLGTSFTVSGTVSATTYDQNAGNNSGSAAITVGDTQAPTAPGTPIASGTTSTQTALSWTAATDNVGVTGYQIYRDGALLGTVGGTSATITGLTAGTTYSFTVRAYDARNNLGPFSGVRSVTTTAAFASTDIYQIQNVNSNLCVDAENASTASGTRLLQFTCTTTFPHQQWRFVPSTNGYYTMQAQYSTSLVWTVPPVNGVPNNADNVSMFMNTRVAGAAYQEFLPVADANGTYTFVARSSAKCLDVPNASTAVSVHLQQFTCNGTPAQSFRVTKVNAPTPVFASTDLYQIRNEASNLCIDAENASTTPGTRLLKYTCTAMWPNQQWRFVATTNGYYTMQAQYSSSLVWTVPPVNGAPNNADNVAMFMNTRVAGATYQEFLPVAYTNGDYVFVARSSAKCLDAPNVINAHLQQVTCNGTPAQVFRLSKVN